MSSSRGGDRRLAAMLAAVASVAAGALVASPGRVASLLEASARVLRSMRKKRKPVRVYMDGCFDLAHFGHANALRQAKACGDTLVVGLIPDSEVVRCKGPPVLREAERRAVIASVRWVDEIIENVPYDLTPEFCETLYAKHGIDFIVHGDDPCLLPDGTDAYDAPKRAGKFKMIKRTEGVSTTDIVNRILFASAETEKRTRMESSESGRAMSSNRNRFFATTRRIAQFGDGGRSPQPGQRVVYAHGTFDLFNAGHVSFLRRARALGDFLLVGVHDDDAARAERGEGYPVFSTQERALGVMACRHVDDVIIGAPSEVTRDLIATFGVAVVVAESSLFADDFKEKEKKTSSTRLGDAPAAEKDIEELSTRASRDPNYVAKELGVYREVERPDAESADGVTLFEIVSRVSEGRAVYESRNARKNESEANYYREKSAKTIETARER